MEILKRVWEDVQRGENVDLYAGILLAFAVVIVSLLGIVTSELVASLTLAILGLLTISNLVSRYRLEEFSKSFNTPSIPFLRSRKDLNRLSENAREARDILIIACSASNVLLLERNFFINKVRQGGKIRLAFIDPNEGSALELLGRADVVSASGLINDIAVTIDLVKGISVLISSKKLFQVRVLNYIPSLSFVMIDSHLPTGQIFVEMYPYKVDPGQRPHLMITAKDHPDWYSYFRDIGEAIWRDAKPTYLDLS